MLGHIARALLLSSLGLCASRSSLGLAALRSLAPGVSASPFASSASRSAKLEDISTDRRPEHEARERGNFLRPGFGSSAGCFSPWLPGERGTPLAPGGLGRRRRQPPPASAGQQLRGAARLHAKRTDGPARAHGAHAARLPRAHTARIRRVLRRATGASPDAQPARLPARRTARLPARLPARRTARLPTRTRRVSRRAD